MGARPCRRARPPSLGDPRRRVALVLDPRRRVDLLSPAPFLLFFSLSSSRPRPRPSSPSFPHFLLPHRPWPARRSHAIRAPVPAEPTPSRPFLMIKWPLWTSRPPAPALIKVILVSPFPSVGLVFRFVSVSCTSTRHFSFPISSRQYHGRRQESLYLEGLEGPGAVDRPRRCHCRHCHCCRYCRRWRFRQPRQPSESV